jgi:hypothetical protein
MEFTTISFLGIHRFEDGAAIRGGILVTDTKTKPLEFRVTAPVRPQKLQKILHGELLDEHICVELMALPLLNAIQQRPSLIIVRDSLLLEINSKQEVPTILILKENEPLFKKGASTQQLNLPDSGHPPVKICTSGQFEPKMREIAQQLESMYVNRNLIEPFDRIEKACEDVHSRKVGDT